MWQKGCGSEYIVYSMCNMGFNETCTCWISVLDQHLYLPVCQKWPNRGDIHTMYKNIHYMRVGTGHLSPHPAGGGGGDWALPVAT